MKVKVELRVHHSMVDKYVYLDGVAQTMCAASRELTNTTHEDADGIFSAGNIEYVRPDGTHRVFSQPEPLKDCTPSTLIERIRAVQEWVRKDDAHHVIAFEV